MSNESNDTKFTRCEFVRTASAHEFARAPVLDGFTGAGYTRRGREPRRHRLVLPQANPGNRGRRSRCRTFKEMGRTLS